jgi:hypothetical protein
MPPGFSWQHVLTTPTAAGILSRLVKALDSLILLLRGRTKSSLVGSLAKAGTVLGLFPAASPLEEWSTSTICSSGPVRKAEVPCEGVFGEQHPEVASSPQ